MAKHIFRNALNNIKKYFSHNDINNFREQGIFSLGTSWDKKSKVKSTLELLQISAFVRCVQIISNDIACSRFIHQTYSNKKNNGGWKNNDDSVVNYLLNESPNSEMSAYEFKKTIVWNLFLYGRAAIYVNWARDSEGKIKEPRQPIEMIPIFSNYIKRIVKNGKPEYTVTLGSTDSSEFNKPANKAEIKLQDDEVIWIVYEQLDSYRTVEFRTLYPQLLEKINQADQAALNAFINDTGLSLFVKIKDVTNKEQKEAVQESIKQAFANMKRTGSMAMVLDEKWDISQNAQVLPTKISSDLRQMVSSEFAAAFGVPACFLGVDANNSYGQQSAVIASYADRSLKPLLTNIMQKINMCLFPLTVDNGKRKNIQRITYSMLELGSVSISDIVENSSKLINAGVITPNESRLLLGKDSREDGNTLYANSTLQPIELIANQVQANIEKTSAETHKLTKEGNKFESEANSIEKNDINNDPKLN